MHFVDKDHIVAANRGYVQKLNRTSLSSMLRELPTNASHGGVACWRIPRHGRLTWEVVLMHVGRESNTVVDKLASIMCNQPIGDVSFIAPPHSVRELVTREELVMRQYHEDSGLIDSGFQC
ncbi:hypothetical protein V6N13_009339 [Hibiscus sabdariffa]